MKKFLLSIVALTLCSIEMNAQVTPSYNLDSWIPTTCSSASDPTGWASFNLLSCVGMTKTVLIDSAEYEGTVAAKITTAKIPAFVTVPGYDTVGLLVLGTISLSGTTPTINYGTPYTNRPATVTFATKYSSPSLDTGWVLVQLTKFNTTTNKADTMASGKFQTSATNTTWTLQSIDLTPSYTNQNQLPDTMKIYCSSSSLYRPKIGSTLWVDDFKFNNYVGIEESAINNNVTIFPNPASHNVSIKCSTPAGSVDIIDITGRRLGNYSMTNSEVSIETQNLANGIYMYNIIDKDKKIINRGKFEVAH
jgi:hypothetical protein